ncbi:MAG: hypothetical protein GX616_02570 [Planctomycetes bacterium]|nr:hypothetical protein [Planctomycetota bacterium]
MSKITLAILTVAAFLYACWLAFFRQPLPDPRQTNGLRRRFLLATLLFVGCLTACDRKQPEVMCYTVPAASRPSSRPSSQPERDGLTVLKSAWRALDPRQSEDFRKKLEAAVGEGAVQQKTADMLAVAYEELAYHKQRTRSKEPQPTCYEPTVLGSAVMTSREKALKQIELLNEARARGAIDDHTARKTREVLARELELLYQAERMSSDHTFETESRLVRQYDEGKIIPTEAAQDAAKAIVDMERQP